MTTVGHRAGSSHRRPRDIPAPRLLVGSTIVFLACCVVFGGDAPSRLLPFGIIALSGAWLLALAVYHGGLKSLRRLPLLARLLLLFLLLPFLQLISLSPEIWRALPGRQTAAQVLDIVGKGGSWRPLTLSVEDTLQAAISFLCLAGLVLATLQIPLSKIRRVFLALLALGALHLAVGVVQTISGATILNLYRSTHQSFFVGLFSNKNHSALFIVVTLLLGYAVLDQKQVMRRSSLSFALPIALLMSAALLLTFSRAGLFLGAGAIAIIVLLTWEQTLSRAWRTAAVAIFVLIALLALISSTEIAERALGRFSTISEDSRWAYWVRSWPLVAEYMPWGAGLGTFPALYAGLEQLEWLEPVYLNHVHNDYVEFLIEAGVLGGAILLLAFLVLIQGMFRGWRARQTREGRYALIAGGIVLLCALHSIVDYPLRRMGIAAVFFFAYTLVAMAGRTGRGSSTPSISSGEAGLGAESRENSR